MKKLLLLLFLAFSFNSVFSQDDKDATTPDFRLFGSVYLRPTMDARDFSNKTHPLFFTLQRVSIGVEKEIFEGVSIFAEAMDSRVWGQEQNVNKSIANLDLNQGFLKINDVFDFPVDLKIGRFQMEYNKKVLGPSLWQDVPRTFDGFDITYRTTEKLAFDFFFIQAVNSTNYIGAPTSVTYPEPSVPDQAYYAPGATFKYQFSDGFYLQPIVLYESQGVSANFTEFNKLTTALDIIYKEHVFDFWFYFGIQNGKIGTKDLSAYAAHAYLGYNLGFIKPVLIADIVSGTKPEDAATKNNLYCNNFGNKYGFWGKGDYFTNMAASTNGLGLNDFGLKLLFNEGQKFSAQIEGHYFMTNVSNTNGKNDLGQEFDLILKYTMTPKMYIDWGFVAFNPGEITKALYTPAGKPLHEDLGFFSYMRFMFNF